MYDFTPKPEIFNLGMQFPLTFILSRTILIVRKLFNILLIYSQQFIVHTSIQTHSLCM